MTETPSVPTTMSAYDGFLEGLEIEGFRSFREGVRIAPLGKLNVFIGPNNAGKSNVLLFVARHLPLLVRSIARNKEFSFANLDKPQGAESDGIRFTVAANRSSLGRNVAERTGCPENSTERLFDSEPLNDGRGFCWFRYFAAGYTERVTPSEVQIRKLLEMFPHPHWNILCERTRGHPGRGGSELQQASIILNHFGPLPEPFRKTSLISALRRVTAHPENNEEETAFSGDGLIEELSDYQHPDIAEDWKQLRFARINQFLREVCECESAN